MAVVINGTTGIDKVQDGSIVSADLDTNIAVAGTFTSTGLVTASAGVAIGGTGSANTLDDYEEGTWVPAILSAGNACDATVSHVDGVVYKNRSLSYSDDPIAYNE